MSYQDADALILNSEWMNQAQTAIREQAVVFGSDARPEYKHLARALIRDVTRQMTYQFATLLATEPGVTPPPGERLPDDDMREAVIAAWPAWGVAYVPET